EFHRRWLAIAGIECDGLGARSEVGFGTRIDGKLCWFSYRSSNPHWQESAPEAKQVLLPLAGSPERLRCQPCEQGFVAEIALPVEFGA
ncbi:MAG: hypothetical protein JO069_17165, partial [Verrucomicrobia bacterium]|nr:hypothetical protein [Verrucomicrobiota bacterium]